MRPGLDDVGEQQSTGTVKLGARAEDAMLHTVKGETPIKLRLTVAKTARKTEIGENDNTVESVFLAVFATGEQPAAAMLDTISIG